MVQNVINIDHQLIYKDCNDGRGFCFHLHKPKTSAGKRVIPMTANVRKAFCEQRKIQLMMGARRDIEVEGLKGYIFIGRNGMPMMPSAVNSVLYNIVKRYNMIEELKEKSQDTA